MIYGSVCSGMEAASVAWTPLGWKPAFFSEIEAFPRAVLQHHYPDVPLHGDFTTIKGDEYGPIDLLCGGTPCQSFSVAGLRGGLEDERGNLSLEFIRLASRTKPRWVVWENVPGVFSALSHDAPDICPPPPPVDMECDGQEVETSDDYDSEELHAFQCFVAGLQECGYGVAYRVFDAQYFGVPQRRRRVVVVGYLGDWRPAAAVLFEPDSLRGDITPRREKGKEVAGTFKACAGSGGWSNSADHAAAGYMIPAYGVEVGPSGVNYTETAPTLDARCKDGPIRNQLGMMVANTLLAKGNDSHGADISTYIPEVSHCLNAGGMGRQDYETETLITSPIAFKTEMSDPEYGMDVCPTLQTQNSHSVATQYGDVAGALTARHDSSPCADRGQNMIPHGMAVRRLTPRECERLQGFPDDYSLIPYRGKPAADGPRYKAIGNSWAVPKFRWVGERIQMVERFLRP